MDNFETCLNPMVGYEKKKGSFSVSQVGVTRLKVEEDGFTFRVDFEPMIDQF